MLDQALLLEKTTHVLTGTYDFQKLAQQAVDLIVREQSADSLISAAIFRAYPEKNEIRAYAYSTKRFRKMVDMLLPTRFENLSGPLTWTDNLTVQTYVKNQMQHSTRLFDFCTHVLSESVASKIQKLLKVGSTLTVPIPLKSGKVAGVFMWTSPQEKVSVVELNLIQTFAHQLGLAFSNVFAFERLMHSYKNNIDGESLTKSETRTPSVKFTLRITPKQLSMLEAKAKQTQKTKADLIRELLDKENALA